MKKATTWHSVKANLLKSKSNKNETNTNGRSNNEDLEIIEANVQKYQRLEPKKDCDFNRQATSSSSQTSPSTVDRIYSSRINAILDINSKSQIKNLGSVGSVTLTVSVIKSDYSSFTLSESIHPSNAASEI